MSTYGTVRRVFRDRGGRVVPGAIMYVYEGGTGNLATLYDVNSTGTPPVPGTSNPTVSDSNGVIQFKVHFGTYDFQTFGADIGADNESGVYVGDIGAAAVFTGATPSLPGTEGSVPAPVAGDDDNFLRGDATWQPIVIPSVADMTGATGIADGTHGLAPKPVAGDQAKFLRGDATWQAIPPSTGVRTAPTYTTGTLASGATESTGTITLPPSGAIFYIETDFPARVRLYLSSAQRTGDLSRPVNIDPTGDHGVILEVVTTDLVPQLSLSPVPIWAGLASGTTGYLTITNNDTVSRAVTLTLNVVSMEA